VADKIHEYRSIDREAVGTVACVLLLQIRKSVRKKHTLPAYKLRYQPFFTMPSTADSLAGTVPRDIRMSGQRLNVGQLRVSVLNCTRLIQLSASDAYIHCTVSIGNSLSLVCISADSGRWIAGFIYLPFCLFVGLSACLSVCRSLCLYGCLHKNLKNC